MRLIALVVIALAAAAAIALGSIVWGESSEQAATLPRAHRLAGAATSAQEPARIGIDRSTLRAAGSFHARDGRVFTVSDAMTNDHRNQCVVVDGRGSTGVACDLARFARQPVQFVEGSSAGPGGTPVTAWTVGGVAAPKIDRLELTDSTGRTWPVTLSHDHAFFFELPAAELARGVEAVSLSAFAHDGDLVAEVDL